MHATLKTPTLKTPTLKPPALKPPALKPDDVFRAELALTTDHLKMWANSLHACATVELRNAPGFWSLEVAPLAQGACPFELMLRADQRYDLAIAGEYYEDRPITDISIFAGLAKSIASGHVSRVSIRSALTGALQSLETRISLSDGTYWFGARSVMPAAHACPPEFEIKEFKRYLPFRR